MFTTRLFPSVSLIAKNQNKNKMFHEKIDNHNQEVISDLCKIKINIKK